MDTYRIAIDTFIAEAFECRASVCAIFTGTDIAFQHVQPHTRRDKSELHLMAGSTVLSVPLARHPEHREAGISRIFRPVEYEISTKEGGTLRLTFSKSALVKNKLAY